MTLRAALLLIILLSALVVCLAVVLGITGIACMVSLGAVLQLAYRRMNRPRVA